MERNKERIYFLDYLRGLMVMLVVFDHSMHAYSEHFADFWFIKDMDRSVFIDVLHMHNDAIMMPFLFFLAGVFVIPSYERRGLASFASEKFLRLVVPFVFGIHLIAPFMVYHKKIITEGIEKGFFDFFWNDYLYDNIAQGGFWFLYFLLLMTVGLLIIHKLIPGFMPLLGRGVRWLVDHPLKGFVLVGSLSALILIYSDIKWGAHWWIGFGDVFYLRGSRLIQKILFFTLGAGVSYAGLLQDRAFLKRLGGSWKTWTLVAGIMGALYIGYSLIYFDDGAYDRTFGHYLRHYEFEGSDAWKIFWATVPMVFVRTTLLGLFMLSLTVAYCSVFYHFLNKPSAFWQSLAACSFGIYIFHEPFSSASHVWLYGSPTSPILKAALSSLIALSASWILVRFVFLKLPGFKRIL